jgi:predicted  nucleic acid-binding Zn-ribbon protein
MSHQLDNAIDAVNKSMNTLRDAVKDIPVRREGFKKLHDTFTKSVARLTTEMSYARGQLSEHRPGRTRRRR